ncbi:MAG: flagellar biosynthesis anti-sigma factor FlgM [Phycisphaeraceae bacterium]|nr:flagellar biosynthesis anti-sigma factor FlgM [Phycisphaeraceae bacterium]MBX3405385.1 flagellar biosynthesis anti-sigma factor FlgM [Phycisphaeraceae bacterium]
MAHLSTVGEVPSGRVDAPARRPGDDATRPSRPVVRESDSAEFSSRARLAAGPVRQDLVEQVRRQIETGRYATTEKLDVAAERLARDLDLTA